MAIWRPLLGLAALALAIWAAKYLSERAEELKLPGDPEPEKPQEPHWPLEPQEPEVVKRQIGAPLVMNLTDPAEPFWQSYREILLFDAADITITPPSLPNTGPQSQGKSKKQDNNNRKEGEGTNDWFDDVNVDTMLISEMWSKVEKPASVHTHQLKAYNAMNVDIATRAAALRRASRELDLFLGRRNRLVQELMYFGAMWQRGDGAPERVGDARAQTQTASDGGGTTGFTEEQLNKMAGDATVNNSSRSVVVDSILGGLGGNGTAPALSLENLATYDNQTARSIARMVETLMWSLVRHQGMLLARLEDSGNTNASGTRNGTVPPGRGLDGLHKLCDMTLPMARKAEARFINHLVEATAQHGSYSYSRGPAAQQWRDEKRGGAIGELEGRVCALDAKRAEMRKAVEWLETRFKLPEKQQEKNKKGKGGVPLLAADEEGVWWMKMSKTKVRHGPKGELKHMPELFVWVQSAVELLGAWSTVLMDIEEGVLIALRRKQIAEEKKKIEEEKEEEGVASDGEASAGGTTSSGEFDYGASWQSWKLRNCGATSCYDEATPGARLRHLFGGGAEKDKKPMAGEAWDERDRLPGWGARVWKGVYEKACCEEGMLANILKHGEKTPDYLVVVKRKKRTLL